MAARKALVLGAGGYQETTTPMAAQRPLVLVNGVLQELPAGDTLVGAVAAAVSSFYATVASPQYLAGASDPNVFHSSQYPNGGYTDTCLYNGIPTDGWCSAAPFSNPEWNCRILPAAVVLKEYQLQPCSSEAYRMAKDWTITGSNDTTDGTDGLWTLLDTRTDEPAFSSDETRTYLVNSPGAFNAYKITVSAVQPTANYMRIGELTYTYLAEPVLATPTDTITLSPQTVAGGSAAGTALGTVTTSQSGTNTWFAKGAIINQTSGALTSSGPVPASGTISVTVYADNGTTVIGEKLAIQIGTAVAGHRYWRLNLLGVGAGANAFSAAEIQFRSAIGHVEQIASGGTPFATESYTGIPSSGAFDGDPNTLWGASDLNTPKVIGYIFPTAMAIVEVAITARTDPTYYVQTPTAADVQWSDDGVVWNTAWSFSGATYSPGSTYVSTSP